MRLSMFSLVILMAIAAFITVLVVVTDHDNTRSAECEARGGVVKPYVGCIDKSVIIDLDK